MRRTLLSSAHLLTASILALSASSAWAQTTPAQTPPGSPESSQQDDDPAQSAEEDQDVDSTAEEMAGPLETGTGEADIVVTGSRIARPEFSFPNPIQSFSAEAIEASGETNITDFLVDTPALVGSLTSGETSGSNGFFESAGLNLLNLRNLGTTRTLVLVNSRRHVAGYPGTASVDINTIPTDLTERIDVLTGGTSAIYGADGVSGVVNFVLRRDFEGIRARGQIGISKYGDAGNRFASITAGKNFAGDRGNIAVAYEYSNSDRLNDKDRPFSGDPLRRFELLPDPNERGALDEAGVPDRILYNNVRWQDSSPGGAIDLGRVRQGLFRPGEFDFRPDRTGEGGVYDRGTILAGSGGRTIGGSGTPTAGYFGDFLPYLDRHNANLLGSFEFSPAVRLFVEGKFAHTTAFTISQPTFDFFTYLAPDNAFVQQRYGAQGAEGAFVSRDNLDFGIRGDRSKRDTLRGVIGFDGKLSDHLRYEVSYVNNRVTNDTTSLNDRFADRYYAALDAVVGPDGKITCRINLAGQTVIDENNYAGIIEIDGKPVTGAPLSFTKGQCVPLNILGVGSPSQEALNFVLATHTTRSRITQQVASGYVSGDLGFAFELPGGPIGYAVGAEYRKEGSSQRPAQVLQQGFLLDSSQIKPEKGGFDVKEAFAEITLPVLKDLPFADALTFGGAVRVSDYSTVGNTLTWKVDGVYSPIRDLTFRGTYSQAVRAPNISELFAPQSGTFAFITDPCDALNVGAGSQFRKANCTAQLAAVGLTPAQIADFSPSSDPEASTSRPGLTGGNPNLLEETAKTWTAGGVLRPRFVPGLTVALDYYNIRLRNAISFATATQVFSLCVDQPSLNNVFCNNVEREQGTGFAAGFVVRPENVANYNTEGVDLTLNYRFTPSEEIGSFNLRVVGGYLKNLIFIGTPGADEDEDAGESGAPRYLGVADLTWSKGPFALNYRLAWQDKTRRYTKETIADNPDISDPKFFFYKERWEHDLRAAYTVNKQFNIYAGVNNLLDEKPSAGSTDLPISPRGRYFYVGAKADLGDLFGF